MDVQLNEEVVEEEGIVEETAVQSETGEEYELRTVETVMESTTTVKDDNDSDVPALENVK